MGGDSGLERFFYLCKINISIQKAKPNRNWDRRPCWASISLYQEALNVFSNLVKAIEVAHVIALAS